MENNDSMKIIGALLLGAAVGGSLGILFAPRSGENTRKRIIRKGENLTNSLQEKFDDFVDEISLEVDLIKEKKKALLEIDASKVKGTR